MYQPVDTASRAVLAGVHKDVENSAPFCKTSPIDAGFLCLKFAYRS